jgi:hypothetical protein
MLFKLGRKKVELPAVSMMSIVVIIQLELVSCGHPPLSFLRMILPMKVCSTREEKVACRSQDGRQSVRIYVICHLHVFHF